MSKAMVESIPPNMAMTMNQAVIEEAKQFLRFCSENDSNNRVEALR